MVHRLNKKIVVFFIVFCLSVPLTFRIPSLCSKPASQDVCYGFIVPLPASKFTTMETFENTRVRHLINDLLREQCTVYWIGEDFSVFSQSLDGNSSSVVLYPKGSFLIPFSGEITTDAMITALIFDYNQTHELESSSIALSIFCLKEPFEGLLYKLVEPKIAQHFGNATRYGWPFYLEMAHDGGFLSFEFLDDTDTSLRLNNHDFNVFVWPYNPSPSTSTEVMRTLSNQSNSQAIRSFINKGGSYIGSCYGAETASSGVVWPFPFFSLKYFYFPELKPSFPFIYLALSDTLMAKKITGEHPLYKATVRLDSVDHPLSFGVNMTFDEVFNGPWFVWLGKNSQKIATFTSIEAENNKSVQPFIQNQVVGAPAWVESSFGNGTVVLFSAHPEFVNNLDFLFQRFNWSTDRYSGRRVIYNAFFYAAAEKNYPAELHVSYPFSWIVALGEKTRNLPIDDNPESPFFVVQKKLEELNNNISLLQTTCGEVLGFFLDSNLNQKNIFREKVLYPFLYSYRFCSLLQNYHNETQMYLDILRNISSMLACFDPLFEEQVDALIVELFEKLASSEACIHQVLLQSKHIRDVLQSHTLLTCMVTLLNEPLVMERNLALSLKYSPQMSFVTLKLVRRCWYQYEAAVALS